MQPHPWSMAPWKSPQDTLDDGTPCFIPTTTTTTSSSSSSSDVQNNTDERPIREDYIWMPQQKDLPAGYYHLRTQESYIRIYKLVRDRRTKTGMGSFLFSRNKNKNIKDDATTTTTSSSTAIITTNDRQRKKDLTKLDRQIQELMFNRLISETPNDVHAARMRLMFAQAGGDKKTRFGKAAYLPTLSAVMYGMLMSGG